jgi:hypothetical protein
LGEERGQEGVEEKEEEIIVRNSMRKGMEEGVMSLFHR